MLFAWKVISAELFAAVSEISGERFFNDDILILTESSYDDFFMCHRWSADMDDIRFIDKFFKRIIYFHAISLGCECNGMLSCRREDS